MQRAQCPACGDRFLPATPRSCAERCPSCHEWFYREAVGSGVSAGKPCTDCCAPVTSLGECPICDRRGPGLWQRFRAFLTAAVWKLLGAPWRQDAVPVDALELHGLPQRLSLDVARFEGLRRSIGEHGILVPLIVRRTKSRSSLQVVSGHRRLIAARHLGMLSVPVRIVEVSDEQALELRLAENLHREDLLDVEMAEAFERIFLQVDDHERPGVSDALGIDNDRLAIILDTLQQPPEVRERVIYGAPPAQRHGTTQSPIEGTSFVNEELVYNE